MKRLQYMFVVIAAWVGFCDENAARADAPSREYQVKAAFIYNFAQFVEWPATSFSAEESPIIIATLGEDPFHGALEQVVQGKSLGKRPLIVRHVGTAEQVEACHI